MKSSLTATTNYALFDRSRENRPVSLAKRRRLRASMEEYGWLKAFPMFVQRNARGALVIIDGQHRFEIAKELGLSVWYVEDQTEVDVTKLQGGMQWTPADYAGSFAQRGKSDYARLMEFAQEHNLPVTTAAALLAGTVSFGNVIQAFHDGRFIVKDDQFAETVARIFAAMKPYGRFTSRRGYVDAIAACVRVPQFNVERFLANLKRCPERLQPFNSRDAVLLIMEDIYNYARKDLFGLKVAAERAMRERNAVAAKPIA